ERSGALCLVSAPETLAVGRDKLLTGQWLQRNGFAHPRYAHAADQEGVAELIAAVGFPLVAKPRVGQGGDSVVTVHTLGDIGRLGRGREFLLQQYLGRDEDEFTVGTFCDAAGSLTGTVAMRRELRRGTTYRAQIGDFPEVTAAAEEIVSRLRPL